MPWNSGSYALHNSWCRSSHVGAWFPWVLVSLSQSLGVSELVMLRTGFFTSFSMDHLYVTHITICYRAPQALTLRTNSLGPMCIPAHLANITQTFACLLSSKHIGTHCDKISTNTHRNWYRSGPNNFPLFDDDNQTTPQIIDIAIQLNICKCKRIMT